MNIKITLFSLILVLFFAVAVSYYNNKEGFDNISGPRVTLTTQVDKPFINILGNTNDGSTLYGGKLLFHTKIPVLGVGEKTNDSLAIDLVVPPQQWIIANPPITAFKNGWKYYLVTSDVSHYIEGTTPLLGSFVYTEASSTPTPAPIPTPTSAPLPTPSSVPAPPTSDGASPQRNDVVPEISISGSGYESMTLQQRAELLKDIQKAVRNEILSHRATKPIIPGETKRYSDSDSTAQGKEYENTCYKDTEYRCPKNPDGSCPPVPDMSQYIRKDAIPCWGCSLDY